MSSAAGDIWCEDCGAVFRNDCHCPGNPPLPDKTERWTGFDGHAYVGDPQRASSALHDTANCRCPGSANFDPDEWY